MQAKKGDSAQKNTEQSKKSKTKTEGRGQKPVPPYLQNRELSWLTFNKRVLDQGEDRSVPLLERLTFVSIFSSNLREFFMVRVGSLTDLSLVKKEIRDNKTQMTPDEQILAIHNRCHELYPEQERIFFAIQRELAQYGIRNLQPEDLSEEQTAFLYKHLRNKVLPYLSPQIINARHPFPHLENGALYLFLRLNELEEQTETNEVEPKPLKTKKKSKNIAANDATFGLIPLPRQAQRIIKLPGEGFQFILLENALKLLVEEVFSMYSTKRAAVICVTRNADIDPNDSSLDELDYDYREHMKRILKKRSRLAPVRLETDSPLPASAEKFLLKRLNLQSNQMYTTKVPLNMEYAWGLSSLVDSDIAKELTNTSLTPQWPASLDKNRSILEQVCEKDILLSYPFESMDPFVAMLREAANDPSVLSIKITLYRLADRSNLAEALLQAAENGKEVTALFELRARFDESNNIEWSQRFEQAGANVIYGFHEYKVHSKICAITRHTDRGLQHITQLGTGNYNEKTSKLYTDFSFITADEGIGKDAAEFFRNMSLENASDSYQNLSVAPLQIKPMILSKIDEQIERAQQGLPNGLLFKTNSITDRQIIDKIAEASQAGVQTTLFVRGISCIIPGIEGYTENVKVVSIVGRLLEHSRIYCFGDHDNREIYLSSADLMTRNMEKRIEIAWKINNDALRASVTQYLDTCLSDTAKLRMLQSDATYTPLGHFAKVNEAGEVETFDSHAFLIQKAVDDYEESLVRRKKEIEDRMAAARAQRLRDEAVLHVIHDSAPEPAVAAQPAMPTPAPEPVAAPVVAPAAEPTAAPAPEAGAAPVAAPAQTVVAEVIENTTLMSDSAIQLVEKKSEKASLWVRLKFLFTGRL